MGKMISKWMHYSKPKRFIATFIPLILWGMVAIWFYLYSQGSYPTILGKMSSDIIFPYWLFLAITLPLCGISMAICYLVMVAKEVERTIWKETK
jgi:hypothetical protein